MSTPALQPGGTSIASYTEPITNALIVGGTAFAVTYGLSNNQQRGAFNPLIVAASSAGATLISQTLISPAITNTFQLQTKSVAPPSVYTTPTQQTTPPPPNPNAPFMNGRMAGSSNNNLTNSNCMPSVSPMSNIPNICNIPTTPRPQQRMLPPPAQYYYPC